MFRRQKNKIMLALLAASFFVPWGYYFYFHLPWAEEAAALSDKLAALATEEAALDDFFLVHADFPAYEASLREKMKLTQKLLPENMATGEFVSFLERTAKEHDVTLKKISPGEERRDGNLLCLPLDVACSGDYFAVMDFWEAMQEERFVRVEQGDIKAAEGIIAAEFRLLIYSRQ